MFIHPMWESETQRLGKQRCTSIGYKLHVIAEMIGFLGLAIFLGSFVALIWSGWQTGIRLFIVSIATGVISKAVFEFSWWLAVRRGFHFDGSEASWYEEGERVTFRSSIEKET